MNERRYGYEDTQHASGDCSVSCPYSPRRQSVSSGDALSSLRAEPGEARSRRFPSSSGAGLEAAGSQGLHCRSSHPGQSLASLTRIEILPSSISILGPRYNQRLLVEGTFADGHQEELTPQVTLTVSNPKVAIVDKDHFTLPQGDGQATITGTLQGHRAVATVNVKDFAAATCLEFSQRCAARHDEDGL